MTTTHTGSAAQGFSSFPCANWQAASSLVACFFRGLAA